MTSKPDIAKLKEAMDAINKKSPGSIFLLGKEPERVQFDRISSGIPEFDYLTEGGVPEKRIIQAYGPESAGKTSIAMHLLGRYPLAGFIDAEGTFDPERLTTLGVDEKRVIVQRPETMEDAFMALFGMVEAQVPFIVVDS